jgi:hypothetical protein
LFVTYGLQDADKQDDVEDLLCKVTVVPGRP